MATRHITIFILLVAIAAGASAADFDTVSYPLGVNVEGNHIPSTMYLKLTIKEYNLPLEQFALGRLDAREAAFHSFITAIQDKAYVRAETLFDNSVAAQAQVQEGPMQIRAERRTPRQVVDLYHSAFGGLRDVTVVAQILSGSNSLFVWEIDFGKGPIRRAFRVSAEGQKTAVSEVTMGQPVELLILNNVMNDALKNPRAFQPMADLRKRFEVVLPTEGGTNPPAHPVVLQFDGQPVDIDIFAEGASPSEITRLYRAAYRALRLNAIEEYLGYFTPRSREKTQKWFASMSAEAFQAYHADKTTSGRIRFIINADPVYLVFRTPMTPQERTQGDLTYDYLVRDPGSGKLVFTNVGNLSFLDDVLQNPALFNVAAPAGLASR